MSTYTAMKNSLKIFTIVKHEEILIKKNCVLHQTYTKKRQTKVITTAECLHLMHARIVYIYLPQLCSYTG